MLDGYRMRIAIMIALAGVAASAVTVDFHRDPPWTIVLFAVVVIATLVRFVPDDRLGLTARVAIEAVAALAVGILFGIQPNAAVGVLLYVGTVYAGGEFPVRASIPLALLAGASVTTTSLIAGQSDFNAYWIGVSVIVTVWAGIAGRARRERTRALEQLVEQTRRTAESEARSGALAERARIARDLHDVLAHTLSGAGMQLELADALLEAGRPDDARAAVQRARGAIADGVTEARGAVHALREDTVDLPATLAALADGPEESVETEPVELTDPQARAVLRVAQEAFTNARRYAPGAPVRARLSRIPDGAELTVVNDTGRPADGVRGSGMGLIGMRERAAEIGGTLQAGPNHDGGWTVRLTVPLPTAATKEL
ncbi:histidine kinase [Tsukamurella sp. NPDC003166]|uniref:sensor histidine kinase n=1 Tax=Tsukamurella sp. NPDC003166 TaxID=3154444 RepID=UPI0033A285F9